MRLLNICNYFPPFFFGGAEVAIYNSCRALRESGVDATVLMTNARFGDEVDRTYTYEGIPVHELRYTSRQNIKSLFQVFEPRIYQGVRQELERVKPDLVHLHNLSGASLAPIIACRDAGVPAVLTLHDHWLLCANNNLYQTGGGLCDPAHSHGHCPDCFRRYDFWADVPYRKEIFRTLTQSIRRFFSPSRRLVDLHVEGGYDAGRFRVIPYGIPYSYTEGPVRPDIQDAIYSSTGAHTLLLANAIIETKGVQVFIDALPLLVRYIKNLRVWVAGDGEQSLIDALRQHTPFPVQMFGKVPFIEMRPMYAMAGLTVVPSIWYDNSPMVIYESMFAGTPVVGTDIGGIPELIVEGETGYLFQRKNATQLAERIISHFSRPAIERRQMRRRCIEYARSRFTLDCHLDALQSAYREALTNTSDGV